MYCGYNRCFDILFRPTLGYIYYMASFEVSPSMYMHVYCYGVFVVHSDVTLCCCCCCQLTIHGSVYSIDGKQCLVKSCSTTVSAEDEPLAKRVSNVIILFRHNSQWLLLLLAL